MMTAGLLMILLAAFSCGRCAGDIENARWLKWVPWVIVLPYVANMCGWILTEMGRQPWIVQGLLKVQDAVSPNLTTAGSADQPDRICPALRRHWPWQMYT